MSNAKKVLFQLSGSIACFKACAVVSQLVQKGYEVEVAVTEGALNFVGEATLEGLTGRAIHKSLYAAGQAMTHIHLVRWADLIILCPATANVVGKMATGLADDLVSTMFLAHDFKKPYLVVPAMNAAMFAHPAVRASFDKIASWGVTVLPTAKGNLACGEIGDGRMLEPDEVLKVIARHLGAQSTSPGLPAPMKILISSGGTREPIDSVRSIANFSTGKTGAALATRFLEAGLDVTFVHARDSALPAATSAAELISYETSSQLEQTLREQLSGAHFDAVIHLAAVSDYSVENALVNGAVVESAKLRTGKLNSDGKLTLELKKTAKIVDQLHTFSINPSIKVVAFKLTSGATRDESLAAVAALARHSGANFVVHNDLSRIANDATSEHLAEIYACNKNAAPELIAHTTTKSALASELLATLMPRTKSAVSNVPTGVDL